MRRPRLTSALLATLLVVSACAVPGADPRMLAADARPQPGCTVPTLGGGETGGGFAGIPAAQAALLGRWVDGMWLDNGVCHALTVESIAPDGTVTATFANGATAAAPPTARRVTGTVDAQGRMELTLPDASRVIYALDGAILRGAHFVDGVMRPVALNRG